jgi:hypothetical protein
MTARNKPRGRKARPITDVTSTALEKKKWRYVPNSLKEGAMWHVGALLGNGRERSGYTTAVA